MVQLFQIAKIVYTCIVPDSSCIHVLSDGSALSDGEDYTDTVVPDG